MTVEQLIAQVRANKAAKLAERNTHSQALAELRGQDAPDQAVIDQHRAAKAALDAEIDVLEARAAELEAEKAQDDAVARVQADVAGNTHQGGNGADMKRDNRLGSGSEIRVGQEPRTYTRAANKGGTGVSFFADSYRSQFKGDQNATQRLQRHAAEVEVHNEMSERATSTGSFAGLVIPQYLPEMAAAVLRNGRPVANIVSRHQIPDQGMNLVIQRGTTGASAAVQTAENTAVSNTDEVWADLTIPVRTISGQQDVSRQALERGYGMDDLIYMDLAKAYAAALDVQVISGSGASGQCLGILNTAGINAATAFGAVPTSTNFNLKIAGANAAIYSQGMGLGPDVLVMHPRRWGWLSGLVDTTGRPIVTANVVANFNAVATGSIAGEGMADSGTPFVGVHNSGLPILLDNNMPTTVGTNSEDVVLSLDSDELHLWEDGDGMPRQLSFEQTTGGSLTTKLVVYSYVAFTAGRYPGAVAKIGGLDTTATYGLVTPTF